MCVLSYDKLKVDSKDRFTCRSIGVLWDK